MINSRSLELAAVVAGLLTLCGSAQAQNALRPTPTAQVSGAPDVSQPPNSASTPSTTLRRMPRTASRPLPQGKPISIDDLLTGITLSNEQKPRIAKVREDMRARMNLVAHDKNENMDQKQAMLQGLQRMELREVYLLLSPDQRIEVRNKIAAQRAAEQQAQKTQEEAGSK